MVAVNLNASDAEVIDVVLHWIDVLAREEYELVGRELGYWDFDEKLAAKSIRDAIKLYRSPEIFPGVEDFKVSDWRLATGGNPSPKKEIVWYEENGPGICASVSIDLPLNGKWSDLDADFLLFQRRKSPEKYQLRLEEISSWKQIARESGR